MSRVCGGRPLQRTLSEREQAIVAHLQRHGASFFATLHDAAGAGYPGDSVDALWDLVWKGLLTNDTFHALRAFTQAPTRRPRKNKPRATGRPFRSRRVAPPSAEGRWSLLADRVPAAPSDTQWSTAMAQQLLTRYGVVTREVAAAEGIAGGFGAVYDVLKALEDAGRVRRGYFVGVGATQFALLAGARAAAHAARNAGGARDADHRGDRHRQSVRDDADMARLRQGFGEAGPTRQRFGGAGPAG